MISFSTSDSVNITAGGSSLVRFNLIVVIVNIYMKCLIEHNKTKTITKKKTFI